MCNNKYKNKFLNWIQNYKFKYINKKIEIKIK